MLRIGAPSSDPAGIAIESTCSGTRRRISLRAWHPSAKINAIHFSIEEFAHALGLKVMSRSDKRRGKGKA